MELVETVATNDVAGTEATGVVVENVVEKPKAAQYTTLPLALIDKGSNPRKHFDEAELNILAETILQDGLLQPVVVRQKQDGRYEIVAGERRYRAFTIAFGPDADIPVGIVEMTDEQVDAAAMAENFHRVAMAPTEEAEQAAKILGRVKGDRDEAARLLRWSRSTLDKRLALMQCSTSVRNALNQREIVLGHAELFAALPKDKQDLVLPAVILKGITVADLKATMEKMSRNLKAAKFDKTDCAACPHNSALQATMFADTVADGSCTNKTCFEQKAEEAITNVVTSLKEEYPVIRILRVGDNETRTTLKAEGPQGVGAEQYAACGACANYGAAVSALPGSETNVYKDQCFDTGCNSKKVAARIKAEQEAAKAEAAAKASPAAAPAAKFDSGGKPVPAAKPEAKVVTSVSESDRIKSYREKVWRKAMAKEIGNNGVLSRQYLIALCMTHCASNISDSKLKAVFAHYTQQTDIGNDLGKSAAAVIEASDEIQGVMMTALAATAMESLEVHKLQQLAKFHKLDLSKHWKLNADLLDLMTKSEIRVIATEVKLDKAIGEGFAKLFNEKKDDLIKKLLEVKDFDYAATIPKIMKF